MQDALACAFNENKMFTGDAVMIPALPESLTYMKPFLEFLESFPPDAINEDIDPHLLEDALRSRLSTGNPHGALEGDAQLLEDWLASFDSSEHPAHWIVGYLSYVLPEDIDPSIPAAPVEPLDPEIEQMVDRLESIASRTNNAETTAPAPPRIQMDVPVGWTSHVASGITELKNGRSWATLMVINLQFFELMHQQHSAMANMTLPVSFGKNSGFKFLYPNSEMANVTDYLLEVAGGYVRIRLSLSNITDNEQQVERCFESLKL